MLGRPIGHSLSPVIHNAGYAAAGLSDWSYRAHDCAEDGLAAFVAGLDESWRGLSLTMPLKEVALDVADEVAPTAAAIGAANTLVRLPDATWRAENTDAPGIVDALHAAGVTTLTHVAVDQLAILGAGGTARAALAAARELGATAVTVYARRPEAIADLDPVAGDLDLTLISRPWSDAADAGQAHVVISTVPKGVADSLVVPWQPTTVLFDALYHPWPTPLAATASAAGCTIISGLDLLLAQAVRQFELFTGITAPVAAMREALQAAATPTDR